MLALVADPDDAAARAVTAQVDAQARAVLERTFAEAHQLGSETIGGKNILLAVLAVEDGTGVLAGLGVTPAAVEGHLTEERNPEA